MKSIDSRMIISWLFLATISVLIGVLTSKGSPYAEGIIAILSIVTAIAYPAVVILLINKLATENGILNRGGLISIWGYCWRTIVIHFVALFITGISISLTLGKGPYTTVPSFIVLFLQYILASVVVCWVLFSRNRKMQLKWLLSLARGY